MTLWELLKLFDIRRECQREIGTLRLANIEDICLIPVLRYLKSGKLDDDLKVIVEEMDELHQLAHGSFFLVFQEDVDGTLSLRVFPDEPEDDGECTAC